MNLWDRESSMDFRPFRKPKITTRQALSSPLGSGFVSEALRCMDNINTVLLDQAFNYRMTRELAPSC
ncbi:MAG: hypothetical protein ACE5D7_03955 [Fidelibacterota bacterium]